MNLPHTQGSTEATYLEKLRLQLTTEMEVMHAKEASLKAYEERLRLLIEHSPQNRQAEGPARQDRSNNRPDQASLDAAWEKHQRAHALLEAARRGLGDDRLALKDREERMVVREQEVARREAWVKVREEEIAAKLMPAPRKAKARNSLGLLLSLGKST